MDKIILCVILSCAPCLTLAQTPTTRDSILKGHPPVLLESLVASLKQEKAIAALEKVVRETLPIGRGSQPSSGKLFAVYEESLKHFVALEVGKAPAWILKEGDLWFQLWERITFEEGKFQTLVEVIRLRESLWAALSAKLAEIKTLKPAELQDFNMVSRWLESRKPVFPVDRIFLLEARARWPQSLMKSAEKITQMLQKKPEIPVPVIVKSLKIKPSAEIANLEKEWSETQIALMKAELENHQKLVSELGRRLSEHR